MPLERQSAAQWCAAEAGPSQRAMIVVAHPDDETIGAAALLQKPWMFDIVHVTDGAPLDRAHWNAEANDRAAYAHARARELGASLAWSQASSLERSCLGIVDQGASVAIAEVAQALAQRCERWRPTLLLTHPYEGGHPDHDAVACAVQAAIVLLGRRACPVPMRVEMAYYQASSGVVEWGMFAARATHPVHERRLDATTRARKQTMLACFASQASVIAKFPTDTERYRDAPWYDFTAPPHHGVLFMETMGWMTGEVWRAHARAASDALSVSAELGPAPDR